jgi:hypothetical protein
MAAAMAQLHETAAARKRLGLSKFRDRWFRGSASARRWPDPYSTASVWARADADGGGDGGGRAEKEDGEGRASSATVVGM